MRPNSPSYYGYRFPPEMISHAVWLYHRFCLSFRDVEDLLAQRGITVSYEAVRLWCIKFGPEYSRGLKRRQGRLGEKWHLDEVFIKVQGDRQYLWRAVGQEGDVFDILVQPRRDRKAAKRFFRRLFKGRSAPWRLVADQLRSYRVAHREVMPPSSTTPTRTETIEPRPRTSRCGNVNSKCEGSNLWLKPSDSCPFMDWSKTSFVSDDTCCKRVITESFEVACSSLGAQ